MGSTLAALNRVAALLALGGLLFHCARADPPPACKGPSTTWWNNANGDSPCKVAEMLFQHCFDGNVVPTLPEDPTASAAVCSDDANVSSCCCNSIAYSLVEACWSCQQDLQEPAAPLRRPTYAEYLQCPDANAPGTLPSNLSAIPVPQWAFIPWNTTDTWKYLTAAQNASTTEAATPPVPDTSSSSASSPASQSMKTKVIVGAVVGSVAGTTLLFAVVFLLCLRTRNGPKTPPVAGRDSFLPRLSEETTLPVKRPPLRLATSSPTVHHITPFTQQASRSVPPTPGSAECKSPLDALSKAMRCSGLLSRASTSHSPSHGQSSSSIALSPVSPSTRTLKNAASSASLGVSYPPSAYTNALRTKASSSSLQSLGRPHGDTTLNPLVIPPARGAPSPTTASAVSPHGGSQAWTTRNTSPISPAAEARHHSLDLLAGEAAPRLESPRGVIRYEADTLIEGWDSARPVRYEVEEDAGLWSENVVRLPPRYSSVHARAPPPATAHAPGPE